MNQLWTWISSPNFFEINWSSRKDRSLMQSGRPGGRMDDSWHGVHLFFWCFQASIFGGFNPFGAKAKKNKMDQQRNVCLEYVSRFSLAPGPFLDIPCLNWRECEIIIQILIFGWGIRGNLSPYKMARYLEQNQIVSQSAGSAETYTVANNNQFSGQLSQRQEKGELGLGGNSSPPPVTVPHLALKRHVLCQALTMATMKVRLPKGRVTGQACVNWYKRRRFRTSPYIYTSHLVLLTYIWIFLSIFDFLLFFGSFFCPPSLYLPVYLSRSFFLSFFLSFFMPCFIDHHWSMYYVLCISGCISFSIHSFLSSIHHTYQDIRKKTWGFQPLQLCLAPSRAIPWDSSPSDTGLLKISSNVYLVSFWEITFLVISTQKFGNLVIPS